MERVVRAAVAAVAALLLVAPGARAAFPGDNGRILFTTGGHDLRTVAPSGGEWAAVPLPADLRAGQAAWSPDGKRIAFRGGPDGDSEIWVADADGGNLARITDTPNLGSVRTFSSQPAWSPDGRSIVFRSDREDDDPDVWIMGADGSAPRRLVDAAGDQRYPALSPDGARLVYRSDADGDAEIVVARSDGSAPQQITTNTRFDSAPVWSPDGARLAFEAGASESGPLDVFSMASDGSDVRQLTTDPAHDEGPAWSPDGTQIAFTSARDGNQEIYVMNADGSGQRRVTDAASLEESPDWQPLPRAAGGGAPGDTAPGAGGSVSAPSSSAPGIRWPRLALLSRTARVDRRGRFALPLRCPANTPAPRGCVGSVVVQTRTRPPRRRARAALDLRRGERARLRLALGPRTRALLRARGRLTYTAVLRVEDLAVRRVVITLRRA